MQTKRLRKGETVRFVEWVEHSYPPQRWSALTPGDIGVVVGQVPVNERRTNEVRIRFWAHPAIDFQMYPAELEKVRKRDIPK